MRICRGLRSPGGPCALKVNTAALEVTTGRRVETVREMAEWAERFGASVSLKEIALELEREWTAQWEHGLVGCPIASASVFGCAAESSCFAAGSLSVEPRSM